MRLRHVLPATVLALTCYVGQAPSVGDSGMVWAEPETQEVTVPMPDQITSTETPVVTVETTVTDAVLKEPEYRTLTVKVTAYTANCRGCSGKTRLGIDVRNTTKYEGMGVISVDPNVIPLGSKVEIDGEMYYAGDTGGAIKGNKIDKLVRTYNEAMEFGRQTKEVKVYDKE